MEIGGVLVTLHMFYFDIPADHFTCLLVEWFALARTIVLVADKWFFFVDYVGVLCET